jgi:hypothetical protein
MRELITKMRWIKVVNIIILFTLGSSGAFAQEKLSSTYNALIDGHSNDLLIFETNGSFTREKGSSLGIKQISVGKYTFTEDELLIVNYKNKPALLGYYKDRQNRITQNDSTFIAISIRDQETLEYIPLTNVILAGRKSSKVADHLGKCLFKLENSEKYLVFEISHPGYHNLYVSVKNNGQHFIDIYLANKLTKGLPFIEARDTLDFSNSKMYLTSRRSGITWKKVE